MVPIVDPADVDDRTAQVLYTRNVAVITGQCPECEARLVLPARRRRRASAKAGVPLRMAMEHADDCPAADPSVPQVTPESLGL